MNQDSNIIFLKLTSERKLSLVCKKLNLLQPTLYERAGSACIHARVTTYYNFILAAKAAVFDDPPWHSVKASSCCLKDFAVCPEGVHVLRKGDGCRFLFLRDYSTTS